MTNVADINRIIYPILKSSPSIHAAYIYGSYLHSSSPGDLDMYVVLAETENTLEICDSICQALRSRSLDIKLDINICIDPADEFKRSELLPYHIYIAQTGVLAYGSDILKSFCSSHLPMDVVYARIASMANRLRHIYFNSLDDRHNKWRKWLIYGMADAELAQSGVTNVDLRVTAKRFYERYRNELTFLAPLFTNRVMPLDWYVSAYHILSCHLKLLEEAVVLSKHESA